MLTWITVLAATSAPVAAPPLPPEIAREIATVEAQESAAHDPENAYALALIRERVGHWNEATALYRSYVRETGDGGAHAFEANAGIDRIEHAAGFIKVRADTGFDRRVWLDGRPQVEAPPTTLIVPPGKHGVAGTGGAGTVEREVKVEPKQLVEVWLGPGDPPYAAPRPIGCAPCARDRGRNDDASPVLAFGAVVVALAWRRRTN